MAKRRYKQVTDFYIPPKASKCRTYPIRYDLVESFAYRLLKPTARLVLHDMVAFWMRASSWETRIVREGFPYTYAMCREPITDTSFYRALADIEAKGFFERPPVIQTKLGNDATRWIPSGNWESFAPSREDQKALAKINAVKNSRIESHRRRKTDFLTRSSKK